jgi:hypothetical protein
MDDIDIELNAEATAALMAIQACVGHQDGPRQSGISPRSTKWRPTRAGDARTPQTQKNPPPFSAAWQPKRGVIKIFCHGAADIFS